MKKGVATSFYITAGAISAVAIGALIYCLFDYLWAPDSPQRIYSKALKAIKNDAQCADLLGDSIKGFGEDTGRGRRRHIMNKVSDLRVPGKCSDVFHLRPFCINFLTFYSLKYLIFTFYDPKESESCKSRLLLEKIVTIRFFYDNFCINPLALLQRRRGTGACEISCERLKVCRGRHRGGGAGGWHVDRPVSIRGDEDRRARSCYYC